MRSNQLKDSSRVHLMILLNDFDMEIEVDFVLCKLLIIKQKTNT